MTVKAKSVKLLVTNVRSADAGNGQWGQSVELANVENPNNERASGFLTVLSDGEIFHVGDLVEVKSKGSFVPEVVE